MRKWQEKKLNNLVGGITDFVENAKPTQLAEANNLITNKEGILVKRDGTKYNKRITETGETAITNSWEMENFLFVITKDNRCFYINTDSYEDPFIPWTELKGPVFSAYGLLARNWSPIDDTVFGGNYGQMWLMYDADPSPTSANESGKTYDVDGNLISPWATIPFPNVPMVGDEGTFAPIKITSWNGNIPAHLEPSTMNGHACVKTPVFPIIDSLNESPFGISGDLDFENITGPYPKTMAGDYYDSEGNNWLSIPSDVYEDIDGNNYIKSQAGQGISLYSAPQVAEVDGSPDSYLVVTGVIQATDPQATVIHAQGNLTYDGFWDGGSGSSVGQLPISGTPPNVYPLPTQKCVYTLIIRPNSMERYINGELVYDIQATSTLPDYWYADDIFLGRDEAGVYSARNINIYNLSFKRFTVYSGTDRTEQYARTTRQMEKVLADKYNVTLPSSHPYANKTKDQILGWPRESGFSGRIETWDNVEPYPEWSAEDNNIFIVTSIPDLETGNKFLFQNGGGDIDSYATFVDVETDVAPYYFSTPRLNPIPQDEPFIFMSEMRNGNNYKEYVNSELNVEVSSNLEQSGQKDYVELLGSVSEQKLGEVIVWNGPLDVETKQKIEGYLSAKWSIALPEGHPYADGPQIEYDRDRIDDIRLPFSHPELIADWDIDVSNGHTYIGGKTLNEDTSNQPDDWTPEYTGLVLSLDNTHYKPNRALPKKIYISVDNNGVKTPQLRTNTMPRIVKNRWSYDESDIVSRIQNNTGSYNDFDFVDEDTYNLFNAEILPTNVSYYENRHWRIEIGFHNRYQALVGGLIKEFHEVSDTIIRWVYVDDAEIGAGTDFTPVPVQGIGVTPISNFHGSSDPFDDSWNYGGLGGNGVYFDHGHWNTGKYVVSPEDAIDSLHYIIPDNNNNNVEYKNGKLDSGMMFYITSDFAGRNELADESQQYVHPNSNNFKLNGAHSHNDGYSYFNYFPLTITPVSNSDRTYTAKESNDGGYMGYYQSPLDVGQWDFIQDNQALSNQASPIKTFKPEEKLDYSLPWQDDNYASVKPYIFVQQSKGAYWYVMEELGSNRLYQSYVGDPETFNLANYIEFNSEIKGLAEFNDKVIVFTRDDKIHRIEGLITGGQGYIDSVAIDGVFDLLTPTCIVRTPQGVFFPSLDGFCFTDGVRAGKITNHIPDTYQQLIDNLGEKYNGISGNEYKRSIVGSYNPVDQYILFEMDSYQNLFIIDLKQGISEEMPVYLWSYNKPKFFANHSVYSNDLDKYITYINGANKHFEKDTYDDEFKDSEIADGYLARIIAKLKTPNIYFDSKLQRKIVAKVVPTFEKQGQDEYVPEENINPLTDWVGMFIQPKINVDGRDDENLQPIDHTNIIKDVVGRRRFGNKPIQALLSNILTVSRRLPSRNTRGMYYTFTLDEADMTPKKLNGEEDTKSHFKLLNFSVLYAMLGDSANMTYTDAGSGDE